MPGIDVRFSAKASIELEQAISWYESQKPGLGQNFLSAVENAIEKIKNNPFRFSSDRPPIRQFHLRSYPYSIFYTAEDCIYIAAVWHQKRSR